jgi:hypothetical protein
MNENLKYDPEDIESLLLHKQFNELFDEEKEFVLQHIGSAEEYESLRQTLFHLQNSPDHEEWLEPDPGIKSALLRGFVSEEKQGFRVWLNNLFDGIQFDWLKRPAFAVSFATICAAIIVVVAINLQTKNIDPAGIAEAEQQETPLTADSIAETQQLFAENLSSKTLPPAPEVAAIPEINIVSEPPMNQTEDLSQGAAPESEIANVKSIESADAPAAANDNGENAADAIVQVPKSSASKSVNEEKSTMLLEESNVTMGEVRSTSAAGAVQYTSPPGDVNFVISADTSAPSLLLTTDPGVAPVSEIRDVIDLLFTAR